MLVCQRCKLAWAAGIYALHLTAGGIEFKLLCGGCGLGGGATSDRRLYAKKPIHVGSRIEYEMGAAPKVERVELVCTVNRH